MSPSRPGRRIPNIPRTLEEPLEEPLEPPTEIGTGIAQKGASRERFFPRLERSASTRVAQSSRKRLSERIYTVFHGVQEQL